MRGAKVVTGVRNVNGREARTGTHLRRKETRCRGAALDFANLLLLLVTLAAALASRAAEVKLGLLVAAAAAFAATGAITRFRNQPINAVVITWKDDPVPREWTALRDTWWRWHLLRCATGLVGLCLRLLATFRGPHGI